MRPPKGRTWGRRGHTPVVKVTAQGTKRVSMAALICTKADQRSRLIYRIHLDRGPAKGRRKGFTETEYARLLDGAHQQLGGPIVLVWDNLNTHVSRTMQQLIAARLWLTVYQLPPYAPEFNPVEWVWSHLKRSLANLTKNNLDQLTVLVKTRLKRMQYRPDLIEGLTARTGLDLQPP
ncbi:transposase [Streptomyces sp. NBC_00474]|uniref:transposase n=1 Tax=Streptomyces sp. NBC_00474 TaxID=2975754 RepID=UPI00224EA987|nr:transposase [Streptomyces sp. NBC_00474]MCX5051048.1 transposase [Streptomyces sp. NBC_00474]